MKAKELIEILSKIPEEADISFVLQKEIPKDRLKNSAYPYPFDLVDLQYAGYDVGYSDKIITIYVEKTNRGM